MLILHFKKYTYIIHILLQQIAGTRHIVQLTCLFTTVGVGGLAAFLAQALRGMRTIENI